MVLRDILTLIGYIIDTFINTTPSVHNNFQKVRLRPVPFTVYNIQKFDSSIRWGGGGGPRSFMAPYKTSSNSYILNLIDLEY